MVKESLAHHPTTTFERLLLMVTVALLPLQDYIPSIAGFSVMFFAFTIIACYVCLHRLNALGKIWLHPVFLAGYIIATLGSIVELFHPFSSFTEILQIGLMIGGATMMAAICRDRGALRSGIYGYLIAGLGVAGILFLTSFGILREASASNFNDASRIRALAYMNTPLLMANLNNMAITCAQATLVAVAFALAEKSFLRRNALFVVSAFCFVATFLPMSRSGVVSIIVFLGIILWKYGVQMKTFITAIVLGSCILILVPDVVVSRLTFSTEARKGKMEIRAHFYKVSIDHLPEYILTGVGAGNFWGAWGKGTGFYNRAYGVVYGPHNSYIMVTIYWGLIGLTLFLNIIYQAYHCLPPKKLGIDPLAICVFGIALSLLMMTFYSHRITGKEFSLGLGLLVGARIWIWSDRKRKLSKNKIAQSTLDAQQTTLG